MSLACDYFKNMYQYINFSCLLYSLNYQPLHKQLFKEEAKFSKKPFFNFSGVFLANLYLLAAVRMTQLFAKECLYIDSQLLCHK